MATNRYILCTKKIFATAEEHIYVLYYNQVILDINYCLHKYENLIFKKSWHTVQ